MIWQKIVNSYILIIPNILYSTNYFFGLVAQMVDRRLGMAEAPGSNPGQSIFLLNKEFVIKICC